MSEQTGEKYSFCPVCGALMENGVCTECADKAKMRGIYSSEYTSQHLKKEDPAQGQPRQDGYQMQGQPRQDGSQIQGQPRQDGPQTQGQPQQNGYQLQGQWQQNPYQQGSYGQPYQPYGAYPPYPRQIPPQNSHHKLWLGIGIAAAVVMLLFWVVISFFYGYFIVRYTNTSASKPDVGVYQSDLPKEETESGALDKSEEYAENRPYEPEEDYAPSPEDEYYYGPCDAIDEDTAYSFANQCYTYENPDQGIDIVINYLELKGDSIPNVEQLNEALKKEALYYVDNFSDSFLVDYSDGYEVYITSYVTYNDEHLASIVMDEYIAMDEYYYRVDLYPINIDVKNGVILDNDSILKIDEAFAAEFRRRNNEQNGHIDYLDDLSDEALAGQLNDKYSMIAYYTPLGMEIGMNYTSGWVTVTYKDYKEYLAKF